MEIKCFSQTSFGIVFRSNVGTIMDSFKRYHVIVSRIMKLLRVVCVEITYDVDLLRPVKPKHSSAACTRSKICIIIPPAVDPFLSYVFYDLVNTK